MSAPTTSSLTAALESFRTGRWALDLSRPVPRGVREDRWAEGIPAPVTPLHDPDNPSWRKAIRYTMHGENVPVFRNTLECIVNSAQRGAS